MIFSPQAHLRAPKGCGATGEPGPGQLERWGVRVPCRMQKWRRWAAGQSAACNTIGQHLDQPELAVPTKQATTAAWGLALAVPETVPISIFSASPLALGSRLPRGPGHATR